MDMMSIRRRVLVSSGGAVVNGWHVATVTATSDLTNGLQVINAISSELPSSYRYAVAMIDSIENLADNAFLGAIFLPARQEVLGVRWRNNAYVALPNIKDAVYEVKFLTGQTATLAWRTESISSDTPDIVWEYSCIQPGEITRALPLKNALTGVDSFSLMFAVPDLDFNALPATPRAYCGSASWDSANMAGTYLRMNTAATATETGSNWTQAYDLRVASDTKIACFYI